MSIRMELRLRQHLVITPQLQQALRLLQLSSQEFAQEIEQALASNFFLEENTAPPQPLAATASFVEGEGAAQATAPPSETPDFDPPSEMRLGPSDGIRSFAGNEDESDWTEWTEAPESLREALRSQLRLSPMGERDRALAHMLIDELSDTGYLETPLEDLAALIPPEHEVEPEEIAAILKLVQQLDPPGIAARSLRECLMLQLESLPRHTPGRSVALAIVGKHLELLARRNFARLQQMLECDEQTMHTACALIRTLDPRPGRRFGPDDTRYVVPDVLVTRSRSGQWIAAINPAVQPRVRLNRAYAEIASCRGVCDSTLVRHLQEARWLLRNVEQRFATILRVAEAIVVRQRTFFSYGEVAMKPLALKDIAGELGLHESTVCRVTNGKYMATPRGLFEFKHFFSRQLATENGGTCSTTAIRALLKEMIAAEEPNDPLSDAQLARLLEEQGLHVARRTVTKYRTLMRVPSVDMRRIAARPPAANRPSGIRAA